MPEMQPMRPCARCEQEFPEAFFVGKDAIFCKRCAELANKILAEKYSVIEAAHFRAQLRFRSKHLQQKMTTQETKRAPAAAAGD
ncbi:MAG: hypothetical protein AAFV98_06835 [Chloroflexota bacterium]